MLRPLVWHAAPPVGRPGLSSDGPVSDALDAVRCRVDRMPRRWLSFWNQEIQRLRTKQLDSARDRGDADIWVPYGKDKLARRDTVYCVGFESGTHELLLFGRLTIARIDDDLRHREASTFG